MFCSDIWNLSLYLYPKFTNQIVTLIAVSDSSSYYRLDLKRQLNTIRSDRDFTMKAKSFKIQDEHKNTPWFQVVIKSELTEIFL
jgi:hypothetical protein